MCGLITKVALHEPSLSVAVWPRGLGSDKHTNKEETRAESRGKDPPKDSATYSTKRARSLVDNYLWLDIIIIYVKTQECEALNYLCFQGAEGGDTD